MIEQPQITTDHVNACRKLAKGVLNVPPAHAAFWAGSVLIGAPWLPSEHDIAQLAQMAFPTVDSLEIARASVFLAPAIVRIHSARTGRLPVQEESL